MAHQANEQSPETETQRPGRTAILVIHGMGQQQPFQPLDSFVRGLRNTLTDRGNDVELVHFMHGRNAVFDHFVRIQVQNPTTGAAVVQALDVYEFYWSPLTQGRATFGQVLRWFRKTVLTPLKRFAFNIPLIMQKDGKWNLIAQFCKEVWRIVWITLLGLTIVGFVGLVVERSTRLVTELANALRAVIPAHQTWTDVLTVLVFAGVAVGSVAILVSLVEQVRDFVRLRHLAPGLAKLLVVGVKNAYCGAQGGMYRRVLASFGGVGQAFKEANRWEAEIKARRGFLALSIVAIVILSGLLYWIGGGGFPFSGVVAGVLQRLQGSALNLLWLVVLVGLGWFLKVIFVDYLGDVALYVTADETSSFFRTRSEILQQAATKLRYLLKKSDYTSVALVGHSLGSVIAYDTINRMRVEAQLSAGSQTGQASTELTTRDDLVRLKTFITFGSPLDKVLYFFRQRVKPYETVRVHILHELHSFRQMPALLTSDDTIVDRSSPPEHEVYWINFYSLMDPVSARLNFYRDVENSPLWYWIPGLSHVSYWYDPKFYQAVLAALDQHSEPVK